ncbi:MAG TPA: hypothetical protein PKI03_32295, partial [Pseudomonadota bacterium]|nr:hypothetical protein [Pseudomonadota bacterium]
ERAIPRLETVEALAQALQITPSFMAFGDRMDSFMQAPHFDEVEVATPLEAIAKSVGGFVDQKYL